MTVKINLSSTACSTTFFLNTYIHISYIVNQSIIDCITLCTYHSHHTFVIKRLLSDFTGIGFFNHWSHHEVQQRVILYWSIVLLKPASFLVVPTWSQTFLQSLWYCWYRNPCILQLYRVAFFLNLYSVFFFSIGILLFINTAWHWILFVKLFLPWCKAIPACLLIFDRFCQAIWHKTAMAES